MVTSLAIGFFLALVVVGCGVWMGALLIADWRAFKPSRLPVLPAADSPPAGLARRLPVGGQVDLEVWHGLQDLDRWLRSQAARP